MLKRKTARRPWSLWKLQRKARASAHRAVRMLQTEGLPAGIRRDLETAHNAYNRAATKLSKLERLDTNG